MSEQLISVIVPTFNRAYCLPRAIDSALGQSHGNVEVIVVDDGSTDDTRRLIAERFGADSRVRYFRQPNQGVTAARNQGLAHARGDFIALLDSDDVWKPWKLHVQLAVMGHCPDVGMVWTDMEAIDPDGRVVYPAYLKRMYGNYRRFTMEQLFTASYALAPLARDIPEAAAGGRFYTGDIYSPMFMGSLVHTSTVLLRRRRLEQVKSFNEALRLSGEDYDFHLRTCREGPVGFVDLASIQYQIGLPDRLTHPRFKVAAFANCLTTIRTAWERDHDRIGLPARAIRRRFAEVHAWLGEALLDAGRRAEARRELRASLTRQYWQPRTMRLLGLAVVPPAMGDSLRGAFRGAKRLASPLHVAARKRPA